MCKGRIKKNGKQAGAELCQAQPAIAASRGLAELGNSNITVSSDLVGS